MHDLLWFRNEALVHHNANHFHIRDEIVPNQFFFKPRVYPTLHFTLYGIYKRDGMQIIMV